MNFIKNSWKSLFNSKPTNPEPQSSQVENSSNKEEEVPLEVVEELFTLSSNLIKESKAVSDNETKLKLYSFYKQATVGDCDTQKPQMFDIVGRSKWSAWDGLKGIKKIDAMIEYIKIVSEADPTISKKISEHFSSAEGDFEEEKKTAKKPSEAVGLKKVEKVDYSDEYSHPYFKLIEKGGSIESPSHDQLLIKNNSPEVYPLHFAIDKERVDVVKQFLPLLSVEEIESMVDGDGTGILEYAELIENEEILQLVKDKMKQ